MTTTPVIHGPFYWKDIKDRLSTSIGAQQRDMFCPDSRVFLRASSESNATGRSLVISQRLAGQLLGPGVSRSPSVRMEIVAARLGSGQEADVYGPLTYSMIQSILASACDVRLLTSQPCTTDQFILKISKTKMNSSHKNQDEEIRKLHTRMTRQSILLPIAMARVTGEWFRQNPFLQLPEEERPADSFFALEVQKYGGKEMFPLNADPRIRFTLMDIVHMWISIVYIMQDAWTVIRDLQMFMTDIKTENMVWDGHRLRLIDVHFYPMPWRRQSERSPLVLTPRVDILPLQYFDRAWPKIGEPGFLQKYFDNNSKQVLKIPLIYKHVIASNQKQRRLIRESAVPPEEEKVKLERQALMFVVYPIFFWFGMLLERENKILISHSHGKECVKELGFFCAQVLQERGRTLMDGLSLTIEFTKQWISKIQRTC